VGWYRWREEVADGSGLVRLGAGGVDGMGKGEPKEV